MEANKEQLAPYKVIGVGVPDCSVFYPKYDNYDAIEVPYCDAIPSDYYGVMGVPITFLDKYDPEEFEIVAISAGYSEEDFPEGFFDKSFGTYKPLINGKQLYMRLFIRRINTLGGQI